MDLEDVGKSEKSYLEQVDEIEKEWSKFRRALTTQEDKEIFDKVIRHARIHNEAGDEADRFSSLETVFMSLMLEQQLEIMRLKKRLNKKKEVEKE